MKKLGESHVDVFNRQFESWFLPFNVHQLFKLDLYQIENPQISQGSDENHKTSNLIRPVAGGKFSLLKWTAVNESYSFQVLSIIERLCRIALLSNLELNEFKRTKSYFCSAKNNQQT